MTRCSWWVNANNTFIIVSLFVMIWFRSFAMPTWLCYLHLPVWRALIILICDTSYLVPRVLQSINQWSAALAWQTDFIDCVQTLLDSSWWEYFYFIIWIECWIKLKFFLLIFFPLMKLYFLFSSVTTIQQQKWFFVVHFNLPSSKKILIYFACTISLAKDF